MVSAVGLSGPGLQVGHGSRGGWDVFGPERRVTRSEGNVLFELDGQPALHLYKTYLGDRATGLPATALLFPLAVRVPGAEERQLVRIIVGVDEDTQSMTFAGDTPPPSRPAPPAATAAAPAPRKLPAQTLKVDRSFVSLVDADRVAPAIVKP